jgi:hypothetical protein
VKKCLQKFSKLFAKTVFYIPVFSYVEGAAGGMLRMLNK